MKLNSQLFPSLLLPTGNGLLCELFARHRFRKTLNVGPKLSRVNENGFQKEINESCFSGVLGRNGLAGGNNIYERYS